MTLVEGDARAQLSGSSLHAAGAVDGVIHFAGLKAVGESVANPLLYWDVNVNGSRVLAAARSAMAAERVFSSTSTAYGEPETFPLRETMPTAPVHPYAQTKVAVEQMLAALCAQAPGKWPARAISIPLVSIQ